MVMGYDIADTPTVAMFLKRRYLEKIAGIQDPYSIAAAELSKDIFPPVTNTDIFNYLVLTTSFWTSQEFKNHKSLDAFKYFLCGFVNYVPWIKQEVYYISKGIAQIMAFY